MLSFFFFLFPIRELNLLTPMLSHSCARQESGLSNHVEVKVAAIGSDTDMRSPEGLKMNPLGEVSYFMERSRFAPLLLCTITTPACADAGKIQIYSIPRASVLNASVCSAYAHRAMKVPVLRKLDGGYLSESVSICEYIDAEFGPTPVVGLNASARADTSMWVRRVEQKVADHMANAFRCGIAASTHNHALAAPTTMLSLHQPIISLHLLTMLSLHPPPCSRCTSQLSRYTR